jgi:hypothetical protein
MLEILVLVALTRRIGRIIESKGLEATKYKWMAVGLWFGGETVGAILGGITTSGSDSMLCLTYLSALIGAALGAIIAIAIARSVKPAPYTDAELLAQARAFAEAESAPKIPVPDTIPAEVGERFARRLAADSQFAEMMNSDPDRALAGMGLTEQQLSDLKTYWREQHEATSRWLTEVIARKRDSGR